ncbi:MAG: VanZ family protein [Porticoccaceae bacterium]
MRRICVRWLLGGYLVVLVCGTWFPLLAWDWSLGGVWRFFAVATTTQTTERDFIVNLAVYIPFGFFAMHGLPGTVLRRLMLAILCGALLSTGLEFGQTFLPTRFSSLLDILLNTLGTTLGALVAIVLSPQVFPVSVRAQYSGAPRRGAGLSLAGLCGAVVLIFAIIDPPVWTSYQLPEVSRLAAPVFPVFRSQHPRLPAPEARDIAILDRENPAFWQRHRNAAEGGSLYSSILMARVDPGAVDLDELHEKLMRLSPEGRGHQQTIPLALAYDWLFWQWSAAQRAALLAKVAEACDYQVAVIRDRQQLSPYNVQLYNSPLQALMMAALSIHGDSDDDGCMRFSADFWKNRVLPVWRQVMAGEGNRHTGGWHEGGEYVGIGIGQAIYRLPAIWRHATGENLFASEPWLSGFLDFAVYRLRPDATQVRHGNASVFDRDIPDLAALAMEYRHRAAYGQAALPSAPLPTSLPWGPLSDKSLLDPGARETLPLQRYFAGTGLLVARSDWGPDATYVTFKAGHNYWSHMHLDQGAFTIFKGGALAIDSGLYGTRNGSDHHMNYSVQTVAHNLVTITDPDDTRAMPAKTRGDAGRAIANDGGQRRVGSGWGRPAPRDLADWLRQKIHYQTVGARLQGEQHDVVWMRADLTPAYTNRLSGRGDFAARTGRVRHYQRTFVYVRDQDLVIIHDQVESFAAGMRKKWLLHSIHEPSISGASFVITMPANASQHMAGGRLAGQVLLPPRAAITALGGAGFEFFVDGVNYDEGGAVQMQAARKKNAQPGAWRLEVEPDLPRNDDEFLVVMQVSVGDARPPAAQIHLRRTEESITLTIPGDKPREIVIPYVMAPVGVGEL